MYGAFMGNEEEAAQMDLALPPPMLPLNDILVSNKAGQLPIGRSGRRYYRGRKCSDEVAAAEVRHF